jgi:phage terminase large subunit-like protein
VFFPTANLHPWVETMQGEMLRFPTGVHDDIVDALSWAAQLFRKAPKPQKFYVVPEVKELPWRERMEEFGIAGYGAGGGSFMAN